MMPLVRRLALTLLVPLALVVLAPRLPLPGVDCAVVPGFPANATLFGLFALGLTPVLSAYWLVEVTAAVVPRWSRIRHAGPAGRAKLDRAVGIVSVVLTLIQAAGVALTIKDIGDIAGGSIHLHVVVLVASLAGGVCVLVVAARLLSRYGLLNGYITLVAAEMLARALGEVPRHLQEDAGPGVLALDVVDLVLIVGVAAVAFQGAGSFAGATKSGSPYRDVRSLALEPRIPIPASAFQPYFTASALLAFPATLASVGLPFGPVVRLLQNEGSYDLAWLALTSIVMVLFALLLHRPSEVADLASRLGAADPRSFARASHAALRRALLLSFLFFGALILANQRTVVGAGALVLFVAVGADLVRALREGSADVVVWEDRRATAIPLLRAALAAEGVASHARGAATLAYYQIFAPYAPAQIVVGGADVERARSVVDRLILGEGTRASDAVEAAPLESVEPFWSLPRRGFVFALAIAVALIGGIALRHRAPRPGGEARAEIAVFAVDDTDDVFGRIRDEDLPHGQGIAIYAEHAPNGVGATVTTHFARITPLDGEPVATTRARARAWLATLTLPAHMHIELQAVRNTDSRPRAPAEVDAFRTFVVRGPPIIATDDVTAAEAMATSDSDPYVHVTLSSDAATRFEDATRRAAGRRLAIVLDGEVVVAPVVKSAITGGQLSVTAAPRGSPEESLAAASELARRLRP